MSGTAATVFTAMAGGVFALAVAYIGYRAGRRQTTDQATVEHGQWLRGQRQQAYLAFVDTWDSWMEALQGLQQSWEPWVREYEQGDRLDDPTEESSRLLGDAWRAVRRDLERVELLGPQEIDVAVQAMVDAFREMRDVITVQMSAGATCPNWDEWNPVTVRANTARLDFHAAAIRTLRQPPSPEGESERVEE
ncbi:hypothetical protein ADK41_28170 [Streptomyces caelestis]|uniref:Uncharacterized protein n=1 Tax=Streptomyces caelestis TaxID=36816 RepID=A0A0M9X6X5_9ACTN|nr:MULTISPECIES: hypothetical protein [Streptomyces]KOT33280.1 hypothetical protein ADK41_28170 [Streptomyces caelestis]KOV36154.1 hypothetical protein ADK58_01585 [Streptomyces sp. XY152]